MLLNILGQVPTSFSRSMIPSLSTNFADDLGDPGNEGDNTSPGGGGEPADKTYTEAYVKRLREEAAENRVKAKALAEQMEAFKATIDGVDIEEYRRLKDEAKKVEVEKVKDSKEWEKVKEQLLQSHTKEIADREAKATEIAGRAKSLEDELSRTILGHQITVEAAVARCLNPRLVEMALAQEAKVELLEDGRRIVKLYGPDGEPQIMSNGEPKTIRQRLAEMKQDEAYAMLFEGTTRGAGSTTVVNGRKVTNPWKMETRNLTEQAKIYRENPELAKKLAAEAGVTIN